MTLGLQLLRGRPGNPESIIPKLLAGSNSGDLFTFSVGINEFDLIYANGSYVMAHDDKTQTIISHAATVAGLSSAGNDATVAVRYPGIQYDGSTWHLWGLHPGSFSIDYYTAPALAGTWTLISNFGSGNSDPQVRQDPLTGTWYLGYKNGSTLRAGIYSASSPAGPWTDLGYIFDDIGDPIWAVSEEADACPAFAFDRAYMAFAGWDGTTQTVALVELNRANSMRAFNGGSIIRTPTDSWEGSKIFSPVYLDTAGTKRLYYSANGNGATAGWGYVQAA